jgi:hypothetical protein
MTANLQFIPETVLIDFRINNVPSERAVLHKALIPGAIRLNDKSICDFFQSYCAKNSIAVEVPDEGLLTFCFVVQGHGQGCHVRRLLDWMGKDLPLMGVPKDPRYVHYEKLLIQIGKFRDRAKRASIIHELMVFTLANLDYVEANFKEIMIYKCKEFQKVAEEFPIIAMACNDVLKGFEGYNVELLIGMQVKRSRLVSCE